MKPGDVNGGRNAGKDAISTWRSPDVVAWLLPQAARCAARDELVCVRRLRCGSGGDWALAAPCVVRARRACQRAALVAASLLVAAVSAQALDPQQAIHHYRHTVWRAGDGLEQASIRKPLQTRDGFLWFGTQGGLVRFDGKQFTTFTAGEGSLPSNQIGPLAQDAAGRLWIGGAGGLTVREPDGRFRTLGPADGLPPGTVTGLYADSADRLWVAVFGVGLHVLEKGSLRLAFGPDQGLPAGGIFSMLEDGQKRLWVAVAKGGLVRIEQGRLRLWTTAEGLPHNVTSGLALDRAGRLWVATQGGVAILEGDQVTATLGRKDGLPADNVRSVLIDRDGGVWLGTAMGLLRYSPGRVEQFTEAQGLSSNAAFDLTEDRDGNLWVGTRSGLNRFSNAIFTQYTVADGLLANAVSALVQDSAGTVWAGGIGQGLLRFGGGRFTRVDKPGELPSDEITAMAADDQEGLWLATMAGLARRHQGQLGKVVARGAALTFESRGVARLASGEVWMNGSDQGFIRLVGDQAQALPDTARLASPSLGLSVAPDETLWFATHMGLLRRRADGSQRLFTQADGLPHSAVQGLAQTDGATWAGTQRGLTRVAGEQLTVFTPRQGLPVENAMSLLADGQGSLWVAGPSGIARISLGSLNAVAAGQAPRIESRLFGLSDGLRRIEWGANYGNAALRTLDGRLWFGGPSGVAVVNPAALPADTSPPPVLIEGLRVDDRAVVPGARLSLASDQRRLEIAFTAVNLSSAERMRFRYRLMGFDDGWIETAERRIVFNNVPAGEYVVQISASSAQGAWGEQPTELALRRAAHVYQRAWFWPLLALLAVGGTGLAYRARLRAARHQHALVLGERMRIARDLHDTLLQGLAGVAMHLQSVVMRSPQAVGLTLQPIVAQTSRLLVQARDAVWEIRAAPPTPQADLIETLEQALAPLHAMAQASDGPVLVFDHPVARRELPRRATLALERVMVEAVVNALKHAQAQRIEVQLHAHADRVRLTVCDDGIGFSVNPVQTALGGHWGLLGMRERVENVDGVLTVESAPGQGTTVTVELPS
jgi:ligand-binding sensor domain-containing protein/signal transduction histidine kinase